MGGDIKIFEALRRGKIQNKSLGNTAVASQNAPQSSTKTSGCAVLAATLTEFLHVLYLVSNYYDKYGKQCMHQMLTTRLQ